MTSETYVVEVCDNGPGIPKQYRKNIFDKFVRANPADDVSGPTSGLGLGLNISYNIVKRLNGKLELVDGRLPGACFRISLPLTTIEVANAKIEQPA